MRFNILLALVIMAIAVASSSGYEHRAPSSKYKWNLKSYIRREPANHQKKEPSVKYNPAPTKTKTFGPPDFTLPTTQRTTTKRATTKIPTTNAQKQWRKTTTRHSRPTLKVDPTVIYSTSKLGLEKNRPKTTRIPVTWRRTTRGPPTRTTRPTVKNRRTTRTRIPTTGKQRASTTELPDQTCQQE